MQLAENLRIEKSLILRNRWALCLAIVLLITLTFAGLSSYQLAKQDKQTLDRTKKIQGNNFRKWITSDDNSKDLRGSIEAIHPAMSSNLFLAFLGVIGPLLLTILGAYIVGSEFAFRTAKIRAANNNWLNVISVKVILIIMINVVLILFVSFLGLGANRLIWNFALKTIEIASWIKAPVVKFSFYKQLFVLMLGLSFYGLLGAFLALITRNTTSGIVIGLAVPYIEQYAKSWWLPQSSYGYLLSKHIVYPAGGAIISPPAVIPPVTWYPWLTMFAWIMLLLVCMYFTLKKQEIY